MDFICEHVVKRKKEGGYRFKRIAILATWFIVPIAIIAVCFSLASLGGAFEYFKWSVFLIPLFVWLGLKLGPITVVYGEESYEYSIVSGEINFAIIYGDRMRKEWFKIPKISECEKIAPYEGYNKSDVDGGDFYKVYKAVSSLDAPNVYFAIFKDEQQNRCVVLFEVIKKSMKMLKTYYPNTVFKNLSD